MRDQAALEGLAEKTADRLPAPLAVIQRPVVHIHPHELVGQVAAHVAGVLQRVLHRLGAMVQAVLNARGQYAGDFPARGRIKFLVDDIPAQRQRQSVVLPAPPDAQILADHQALVLIRQLALVDDEADVGRPILDGGKYLVERHHNVVEVRSAECGVRNRI